MSALYRFSLAGLMLFLQACAVGPDYEEPALVHEVPGEWHMDLDYKDASGEKLSDLAWVEIFRDEQLQEAINEALLHNREMLIALERIEEARAENRITRSALYPEVGLGASGEREEESRLTNENPVTADEFFVGAVAAWELDLWGAVRRASAASFAEYLSSEYAAQAVRLSLIADVANSYFELQGIESRLKINNNTLHSREQAVDIAWKRHRGGLTSKLEVRQAEVELAATRASLPVVEQRKLAVENQLSLLMGRPPTHLSMRRTLENQFVPEKITLGLPSELLRRRPDIMRAEQQLIAASERVGVATAGLYPNFRLTGALGYETAEFDDLLDNDGEWWIVNLDVTMPLFNAGARRAEVSAAQSRFNQARLGFEETVLQAMRDVSDSLNQFYKSGETLQAQLALETASAEYLRLANKRYRNGVLAYIDVLDAQRRLFEAQLGVSFAREKQFFALVNLYKALGGGWDPETIKAMAES
jgi:NodT family efflux transporter outer membrane factor (OMF) lipoprotein